VRVSVERPVSVRLREITIDQAVEVDGETVGVRDGQLVLSALWVVREGGIESPAEGWTVNVPVDAVSAVAERRVSWWRSAVFGAAIVGGAALGWRTFGVGASGGEGGGHQPGDPL
jgi:hypothetical protein